MDNTVNSDGWVMLAGGKYNMASGAYGTSLGGMYNKVISNYGSIVGGFRNKVNGRFSTILGGAKNTVSGRFSTAMGYLGKVTGDYSTVMALTGDQCEVRGDNMLGACVDKFLLRDGDGDWYDLVAVLESRDRHLEESESLDLGVKDLGEGHGVNAKVSAASSELADAADKHLAATVTQLKSLDYDAALKVASELLASRS